MTLVTGSWLLDAVLLLVPLLYWYMTRKFGYWKKLGIPYWKPTPFVGNVGSVLIGRKHLGEPVLECYHRAGDARFMGMIAFDKPLLMVKDPELVGRVISTDFSTFYATNAKFDPVSDPLFAMSLFGQHGPGWKKLRSALSPAFTSGKIKLMFHIVNEVGQNLARHLETESSEVCYFHQQLMDDRKEKRIVRNDVVDLLLKMKEGQLSGDVDSKQEMENQKAVTEDKTLKLTNELLASQLMSFLGAGFETSKQRKARGNFHYTILCQRHCGCTHLYREAARDYKISGADIVLPKGTGVVISVLGLHNDPRYWKEPQRFMPARFREENSKDRPNYTFLPFGEGPRLCLGMRVAYLQVKLALVHILNNFEVLPTPETPSSLRYEPSKLIGTPAGKVALRFRKIPVC